MLIVSLLILIFGLIYFFISYQNPKNVISRIFLDSVYAQELPAKAELPEEYIQDYQVEMKINRDNTVNITEKIIYDFGDQARHGIYREIPYKYQARAGNFTVGVKVISVNNENNEPYMYTIAKSNGKVKIKIGDPDETISGVYTYIINYQVNRVINFFNDHDELYWNVTGNGWAVPIDRTGIIIKLPPGAKAEDIEARCFTGKLGSIEQNCQVTNVSNSQVGYSVFNILPPQEGLTVVLGWPKGILTAPTLLTQLKWILKDNPLLLLPLIVFLIMYLLWFFRGRDLGAKRAIIPQYETPNDLLPAEIGALIDERVNLADISSTIIDLAVRGYIKIKESGNKDWELIKLKDFNGLKVWEGDFIEEVFNKNQSVKISELENKFYQHLPKLKKSLYQLLVEKDYFPVSPQKTRLVYSLAAIALIFLGLIVMPFFGGGLNIAFLAISGIIIIWLGQYMPRKTKTGTKIYQDILGYKMYLSVAEKARIKFSNAPEKKPEVFEKHLPYAMVLGVEKKWASLFKNIYLTKPGWYEGNFTTFNSLVLINTLNNFNYSAKNIIASQASGAAHGNSGFSGGGFGGGGGGSW